jgi:hypothetical protein
LVRARTGDRNYHYLAVALRVLLLATALLCFILPIALTPATEKGSVTLLVAGKERTRVARWFVFKPIIPLCVNFGVT